MNSEASNEEISIFELWQVLWEAKWKAILIIVIFSTFGVIYSLLLPNKFESEGVFAPSQNQGGIGGALSKYSGLAAIAGISIDGGESDDIDQAIILAQSWPFLDRIVQKNGLKPYIMAVKGWDSAENKLIWDKDISDPE